MRIKEEMPELVGYTDILQSNFFKKDFHKKPTLIHFWSVSCPDCKKRFPHIIKLSNEYKGQINVVSIHMPRSTDDKEIDYVWEVANEYHLTSPILIDNNYKLTRAFRTRFVPSYYLFDKNLKLRHYQSSGSMRMLNAKVQRLIKE